MKQLDIRNVTYVSQLKAVYQVDEELCIGCAECEWVCPLGAISVENYAKIDESLCVECGACLNVCPFGAIK